MPRTDTITLPKELLAAVKSAAEPEHRTVNDLLAEAVMHYLEERSWAHLIAYGRKQGESVGITTEEGIDRAISEWRKENRQRGT